MLGATPELRDLLAEHTPALPPLIVDQSLAMLEAMTALARKAKRANERCCVADWCGADLPAASFDVVLADMIWWTLPIDRQSALRDLIADLLTPDGRFVTRLRCRDPELLGTNPIDLIDSCLARLNRNHAEGQSLRDAMLSQLYDVTLDVAGRRMSRAQTHAIIAAQRDAERNEANRAFLDTTLARLIGADWTSQTREDILPTLLARFDLVMEACADDYGSGRYPVIALRKRAV